jgi:hypothetical protein
MDRNYNINLLRSYFFGLVFLAVVEATLGLPTFPEVLAPVLTPSGRKFILTHGILRCP